MPDYYISTDKKYLSLFELLLKKLEEIMEEFNAYIVVKEMCGRRYAKVHSKKESLDDVMLLIKDIFCDIILINYKYLFFRKHLAVKISDKQLENLFFTSVMLYDKDYDQTLLDIDGIAERELTIDGIMRFCIGDLLTRWKNIAEILSENFYGDSDREAIYEFIKHIVYSMPSNAEEVNVYRTGSGYVIMDGDGRSIADFETSSSGELASRILFVNPAAINFRDPCDRQTMIFLKNIFSDRIRFY
jgi:hypothetical protein